VVRYVLGSPTPHKLHEIYNDVDVFLDFENCFPKESERDLFHRLEQVVDSTSSVINDLMDYGSGASEEVRSALQNPHDQSIQFRSFEIVQAYAKRISIYYKLAKQIEEILPDLLLGLCSGPLPPAEQIEQTQALCKQFARLIDFIFRFDFWKMSTNALQNDFSFYRRVISMGEMGINGKNPVIPLEEANSISLFLANATPMLNVIVNTTNLFAENHPDLPITNTTETLVAVVYICRRMLECKQFNERLTPEGKMFFLRVMIGSLILFDHIDPDGAFSRNSSIDIKSIVDVVKQNGNEEAEQLMNALRYTTKHFKDQETPKSIRALFN